MSAKPFYCLFCRFCALSWRSLLRHTFETHSSEPNFKFICGIDGCLQSFTLYSSINSHIQRKHPGKNIDALARRSTGDGDEYERTAQENDDDFMDTEDPSSSLSPSCTGATHRQQMQRSAALLLLNMKD